MSRPTDRNPALAPPSSPAPTADQATTDAPQGVGADIEPHRREQCRTIELVTHPGNGHRRKPTEQEPLKRAQHQQTLEIWGKGQCQRAEARQQQRHPHDGVAADGVRQRPKDQQRTRQGQRGYRHGQADAQRRDAIGLPQLRQQRLGGIEVDEDQKGAQAERKGGAPPGGSTCGYHAISCGDGLRVMIACGLQ
ncbi:hypothetical protein Q427_12390 [Halomonas sp. BC04]|nr:hypothetical protein Q427_12390 [Halomonas sp. BC04]